MAFNRYPYDICLSFEVFSEGYLAIKSVLYVGAWETNFSASDWSKWECYFLEEVMEVDELDKCCSRKIKLRRDG